MATIVHQGRVAAPPARHNIKLQVIVNINPHDPRLTVSRSALINFPQACLARPMMREGSDVASPSGLYLVTAIGE